ncbi:hypothetical protein QMK33_08955 [Hymenobacter sp. H14-R3]|uniref:hypothetical protein n=1 Tax=Hymenobacter sp. H14-R3 TaxID=3046308 RepID=UPI0024B9A221|nr:hypothetical protein [Hymenobacter sp. H14-R3]MDJ0365281.1 hypothetical protein [Hymenobacter sp. H14-R3]
MRLALGLLLNVLLLSGFLVWLRAEYQRAGAPLRRWLLPALGWRLLLTAASTYQLSPDARQAQGAALLLTKALWAQPGQVLTTLQGASFLIEGQQLTYYQWSNTLFFIKVLALLNPASSGAVWLNTLYLSMLCFVACWSLVRTLARVLPATPALAGVVAFLLWPTVVWWTAGLTKETLVVGAGAGLVALALRGLYGSRLARRVPLLSRVLLGLLLAWLMVRMRYFFALPLLGGLLALAAVRLATRRGWLSQRSLAQAGSLLLLLALAGASAVALGGEHLALSYFSHEVNANYQHGLLTSPGRPHLAYADWQPTPAGLLRHAPLAAAQVLVRPWPGESAQPLYIGAELENILIMSLLVTALVAVWRGRTGQLPVALVVVLAAYCLLLAAFIGLSTPNLGTLHRYRVALLPWLLLLLLQNDYARRLMKNLE